MSEEGREEQLDEERTRRRKLSALIENEGWEYFKEFVEEQAQARLATLILKPIGDEGYGTYAQEYAKGEIAALRMAVVAMESGLEESSSLVESLLAENTDGSR